MDSIKNISRIILLSLILLNAFMPSVLQTAGAQSSEVAVYTFEELGGEEMVMVGPYDTNNLRFGLPANWFLLAGAELQIKVSTFLAGSVDGAMTRAPGGYSGAMLDVYFNGELQQSIQLLDGQDVVYQVPIRPRSLISDRTDGTHDISLFLNASIDCEYDFQKTTISVSSDSQLILPYDFVPVTADLRKLPWPLYQRDLNDMPATMIVIPSQPSASELRAAMLVMAGLGRMTEQQLSVSLTTIDEFPAEARDQQNLVFIGKAGNMPVLSDLDLPIELGGAGFSAPNMQTDDGVIQMTTSPWNSSRVALVVGGNTDAGVVKAAQAFTAQNLQTGDTPSSVVIAEVNPVSLSGITVTEATQISSADTTFGSLGYEISTSTLLGANWFTYEFNIPPGFVPSGDPYLDLEFSHSALVDFERSGVAIYLNGDLVASAALEEGNTNDITTRINLPASAFSIGYNTLDVTITLIPRDVCSVFAANGLWATIYPESTLHLELVEASTIEVQSGDLKYFPSPFANDPSLGDTLMVLPENDSNAWRIAGRLAYELGGNTSGTLLDLDVLLGGDLSQLETANRNLMIVGKPSDLPVVSELGDAMPARFEPSSNEALLENQAVIYRFSDAKSLGYLELLSAPWNTDRTILAVLGTTGEGVEYAANALLDPGIKEGLLGNFATLDEDYPAVVDTRTGQGLGRMTVEMEDAISTEAAPADESADPAVSPSNNRQGILIGLQVVLGLMVAVIVLAIVLRKRVSPPRP